MIRRLYLIICLLACGTGLSAQIITQLQVLPPYSPYLSDYTSRPNALIISVTNTTAQLRSIYFSGSVTGDNGVSAQTKQNYKPGQGLQIAPNATMQYTGAQLSPMFNWDMGTLQGVNTQQVERSGMLPEGSYRMCVEVRDFYTGNIISSVQPSGCSQPFSIKAVQPPIITQPTCGSAPSAVQGQPILFAWTPATPQPGTLIQYRLRIVEIIPPTRNANDAMLSATTPPALDIMIPSNNYLLNPALLLPAQRRGTVRYAFTVTAVDPGRRTVFSNNGVSEVCTFEYNNAGSTQGGSSLGASVRIVIGKRSHNCAGFGICNIIIVLDPPPLPPREPDPPKPDEKKGDKAVPDSRLDPKKPKVYGSIRLAEDGNTISVALSEEDIKKHQPDKLIYFNGKSSVTFEQDNPVAPKMWRNRLGVANPLIIKAGTYPLSRSGGFYVIEPIRIEPLGEPPFYADIPGTGDDKAKDTVPCKDLEEKIKAAESALEGLRTELAGIDEKIASANGGVKDCNLILGGLVTYADALKKDKDRCDAHKGDKPPSAAYTKERCDKVAADYAAASDNAEAQKKECDKRATDLRALEDRKAALPGLIKSGEGELGGLKEALEKCKKEVEEKKKRAEAGGTHAWPGRPGYSGPGSGAGGTSRGGPGTHAPKEDAPCNPEGAKIEAGPYRESYCRLEEVVSVPKNEEFKGDVKDLKKWVKKYGKSWGKKLLRRALLADAVIETVVTVYQSQDMYVNAIKVTRDKYITYICEGGKWVKKGERFKDVDEEDLGWFQLMPPSADLSSGWNKTYTIGEVHTAIEVALAGVCSSIIWD
jgi:TANFOR domain-containing protein